MDGSSSTDTAAPNTAEAQPTDVFARLERAVAGLEHRAAKDLKTKQELQARLNTLETELDGLLGLVNSLLTENPEDR